MMSYKGEKMKYYITKPYLAQPNLNDELGTKFFRTVQEATDYLNDITGNKFEDIDWKLVGKIKKLTNVFVKENTQYFKYGDFNGVKYC